MEFVKYLLYCFGSVFDGAYGGKSSSKEPNKKGKKEALNNFVFLLEITTFITIFAIFGFFVYNKCIKNEFLVWLFTILSTIGTILAFCMICIIVEAVVNLIKLKVKK